MSSPPPNSTEPSALDILTALRHRTRPAHERLDAALDFRAPGSVTIARYTALLTGSLDVVSVLEPALAREIGHVDKAPGAGRIASLASDLAALGRASTPRPVSLRGPSSTAEAYGCAYVLEGSTLGGLVLASMVRRDLGDDAPVAYLTLRGAQTRPAWQAFLRDLADFGARATDREHEAAVDTAMATFDAYARSLRDAGLITEAA